MMMTMILIKTIDGMLKIAILLFLQLWTLAVAQNILPLPGDQLGVIRNTNIRLNIPNVFGLVPELTQAISDANANLYGNTQPLGLGPNVPPVRPPGIPSLNQIQDNYRRLRQALANTLTNRPQRPLPDLFAMDVRNRGPQSSVRFGMPGIPFQVSVDAKARPTPPTEDLSKRKETTESTSESSGTSTEVPLQEYIDNLLRQQTNFLPDVSMSVVGPNVLGETSVIGLQRKGSKTAVGVNLPGVLQLTLSSKESKDKPKTESIPETEKRKELDPALEDQTEKREELDPVQKDQSETENQDTVENVKGDEGDEGGEFTKRSGHMHVPFGETILNEIPFSNSEQESQSKNPINLGRNFMDLSKKRLEDITAEGKKLLSKTPGVNEAYKEYIDEVEEVAGPLSEEAKSQLTEAFSQFKTSLEKIDLGENVDVKKLFKVESDSKRKKVPSRIIDQRELEIAFLNLDREAKDVNPDDQVVLAFTLTGVPVKLHLDSRISNPVKYLQNVLTELGVTLHIPVDSFENLAPVGKDVAHVGAGNIDNRLTEAVALIVPDVEDIKKFIKLTTKESSSPSKLGQPSSAQILSTALEKTLNKRNRIKFSDALSDGFKENPSQVLVDIVNFLNRSQDVSDDLENGIILDDDDDSD